jgi:sugar-phosphatase
MKINSWQPRAVIFDMDGLLVDSEPVWHIAEDALIRSRGRHPDPLIREGLVGLRMDEFLVKLSRAYQIEDTTANLYSDLVGNMLELIPTTVIPRPGASEILNYMVEHNITRAIASSSPMSIIDATLRSQGWNHIFPVRCTADDEPNGKPAPDVYLRAANRLHISPADCLALEDSPNGARAAVAAGMVCYAVPDPSHTRTDAFKGITNYLFDSLHAVLATLN